MKRMKRVVTGLLALVMMFALVACGGKEQTVTYRGEQEESGIKMVDTMTFTAKGDKVQKLVEKIEMDVSSFEDDVKEQLKTLYDGMVDQYNAVDGECAALFSFSVQMIQRQGHHQDYLFDDAL